MPFVASYFVPRTILLLSAISIPIKTLGKKSVCYKGIVVVLVIFTKNFSKSCLAYVWFIYFLSVSP